MIQEIYYTSAPRGLKAGSRGFCTVVSTAGMAKNLADRLESLSGYRHLFGPQDPQAPLNPVVYSHLRLAVGGRQYHVLSRICDAGLDYTQRTNKFAHHVVLDTADLPAGGPAWLLSLPGFVQATWDGETRTLPGGRRPPSGDAQAGVCRAWQQLTGDAGWGGALAETALPGSNRRAVVVFAPGMDMLQLVAEALALLSPEQRWEVTFSTYFTKLPPGIDCKWRFVVEGSPEAAAARPTPQTLVINLCSKQSAPAASALAVAARTGVAPKLSAAPVSGFPGDEHPMPAELGGDTIDEADELGLALRPGESRSVRAPAAANVGSAGSRGYDVGPPPLPGVQLDRLGAPTSRRRFEKKRPWGLITAVVALFAAVAGAGITGAVLLSKGAPELTRSNEQATPASAGRGTPKGADVTDIVLTITPVATPINAANAIGASASGTAEPGASVSVTCTDDANQKTDPCVATADSSGKWTATAIDLRSLKDGMITFTAAAKNAAGNTAQTSATATKDAAAPTISIAPLAHPINRENAASVSVSGTAEANASISLIATDTASHKSGPSTTMVDSSGKWHVANVNLNSLDDGKITFMATAADAAGNKKADSIEATKDTTLPTVEIATVTTIISAANAKNAAASGTTEPGASITIVASDSENAQSPMRTATVDSGNWSVDGIDVSSLADGEISFAATATDSAGNHATATRAVKKAGNPFVGLPDALPIPPFASKNDCQIHNVMVSESQLSLTIDGQGIVQDRLSIYCKRDSHTERPTWGVYFSGKEGNVGVLGDDPTRIARFVLDAGTLSFSWDARVTPEFDLRNCVLILSSEGNTYPLQLRSAESRSALSVQNLKDDNVAAEIALDSMPPFQRLRIRVNGVRSNASEPLQGQTKSTARPDRAAVVVRYSLQDVLQTVDGIRAAPPPKELRPQTRDAFADRLMDEIRKSFAEYEQSVVLLLELGQAKNRPSVVQVRMRFGKVTGRAVDAISDETIDQMSNIGFQRLQPQEINKRAGALASEVLGAVLRIDQEAKTRDKLPVFHDALLKKAARGVHAHALLVLVDKLIASLVDYEVYMPFEESKSRVVLVRSDVKSEL